eukprot:jgi/Ulvmu1/11674/UM008_0083.1
MQAVSQTGQARQCHGRPPAGADSAMLHKRPRQLLIPRHRGPGPGPHASPRPPSASSRPACAPTSPSAPSQASQLRSRPATPPAAFAVFAMPSALATTAAAVAFAHEHVRAIVVALLVQSSLQLLPALFLLFGSPMVVMFADSLGKSGNPVAERNKFVAFAMTSAAVLLAALSFLITSLLGIYAGWNVLGRPEGAAHVITTLAHRLSHAAAVMATFDTLAILTCAVVAANPDCTEPLGMSVAVGWFLAHLALSTALLAVATAHFTLRAAVSDLTFLTPHLYAAVASCFTGLAFGSLLQLPLAGVLSGQFVTAAWAGGARGGVAPVGAGDAAVGSSHGGWGVLRRVGTLAGVAAALLGVFNGGAFLLLNGCNIARWICQAGAALNGVVLLIGGPLAALANVINFRRDGRPLRKAAVACAAFGQPLLTTVICGGLLLVNLRLVQFAALGYVI